MKERKHDLMMMILRYDSFTTIPTVSLLQHKMVSVLLLRKKLSLKSLEAQKISSGSVRGIKVSHRITSIVEGNAVCHFVLCRQP